MVADPRKLRGWELVTSESSNAAADELAAQLRVDREHQKRTRKVLRYQRELRARVDDAAWRVFLALDEAYVGRSVHEIERALVASSKARRTRRR